ncbi:putative bifunctional diguanylate cyclase/phosphodiesterase [Sphingomonas sp.]|uniref:putative bifunctional diguanylate cyclase/phosphodiesterase n=1 Tax=Sphingomonas sp. TaxID=28214 RepID=UPI003B3ACC67
MSVYLQNLILEMIARGETLAVTADRLCTEVERLIAGVHCSIVEVDATGTLRTVAAPSLPASLRALVDGAPAGPMAGACGSAIHLGREVASVDIAIDPRWEHCRQQTLALGIRACWSSPIFGYDANVVGSFAFYYHERRGPTTFEREIVAKCLQLCSIAFDREHRLRLNRQLLFADPLSGLSNRAAFEALIKADHGDGTASALLLIDIDDLKHVNDTFGHPAGDALIRIVCERLSRVARPAACFRLGGDELAVLAPAEGVERLAVAIREALQQPADCQGHIIVPSVTIGVAVRGTADADASSLRQNADFALYHGKETGRGQIIVYAPELRSKMESRLRASARLRDALADGRIEARYQPIACLETGHIARVEALCRIRTPDGRMVAACDFQDGFADAHNAVATTRTILRLASADMRRWMDQGVAIAHVAVNLSTADFAHGRLLDEVVAIFGEARVPLDRLMLEITETVYLGRRDRAVVDQIDAIRARGIKLALDDFGTGYASLSHLLSTPVDTLKIDKSFVDTLIDDGQSGGAAVINGLMRIAEKLGMDVVAEGVETEQQRAQLIALGCSLGQGYLFAPALPANALADMVAGQSTAPPTSIVPGRRRR